MRAGGWCEATLNWGWGGRVQIGADFFGILHQLAAAIQMMFQCTALLGLKAHCFR